MLLRSMIEFFKDIGGWEFTMTRLQPNCCFRHIFFTRRAYKRIVGIEMVFTMNIIAQLFSYFLYTKTGVIGLDDNFVFFLSFLFILSS